MPRLANTAGAGGPVRRIESAFMPRIKARRFLWEVGTFYNERRFLWGVVRFVWAVSHVWTAPPVRAEVYAGSTRPHPRGARFLWAVGTSYNERRILWAVICFVWAVTGIRTAPPAARRGCRANQPAFMPRLANTTAGDSYGKSVRPIMSKRSYGKWYALYKL